MDWKIKFPPFFLGQILFPGERAFRHHCQSQCVQAGLDLAVQAAPEGIGFDDDQRVFCFNFCHDGGN